MKLKAEVEGQNCELTMHREGETVSAVVDGRAYEFRVRESGPREFLILDGTQVHDCRVERPLKSDTYVVHLGPRSYEINLIDPKRLRSAQTAGAHQHGAAEIVASMPGKVVRVLVEVGADIEAGAGIVVVEAMKMQNEMKAPKAGTVTKLNATVGEAVNAGDVLAVVE
jgi:biotin carboxyl carrier protein